MGRQIASAAASGSLFALGLCVAGAVHPRVVLDAFAFGSSWDPSMWLMFAGALAVHAPIAWAMRRRKRALSGAVITFAQRPTWEPRLVIGALVFGVGWGLSGLCPGPMIASALTFGVEPLAVIAGFALGSWIMPLFTNSSTGRARRVHRVASERSIASMSA